MTRRSDIRASATFLEANPGVALLVATVCMGAGVASVLGYLRSQVPLFQWGLAIATWCFAAFCVRAALSAEK